MSALDGGNYLRQATLTDRKAMTAKAYPISNLFLMQAIHQFLNPGIA